MLYVYLTTIVGLLVAILVSLRRIHFGVEANNDKLDALRLTGRTRQTTAVMRTGAVSEERELVRLGRATKGRRIVVGGDHDSSLFENLTRGVPGLDRDNS